MNPGFQTVFSEQRRFEFPLPNHPDHLLRAVLTIEVKHDPDENVSLTRLRYHDDFEQDEAEPIETFLRLYRERVFIESREDAIREAIYAFDEATAALESSEFVTELDEQGHKVSVLRRGRCVQAGAS